MQPKQKTQNELAILYKVPQTTISKIKNKGYDVQNRDEFRTAMLAQNKRPPAWRSGCPWDEKPEDDPSTDIEVGDLDMDQLKKDLLNAGDYDQARFLKTKIGGLREFLLFSIAERDHLPRAEVMEDLTRIGSATQAAHNKCGADLPAMLEGLEITAMEKIINSYMRKIGTELADSSSDLYRQIAE
jgi:hypothetical protein